MFAVDAAVHSDEFAHYGTVADFAEAGHGGFVTAVLRVAAYGNVAVEVATRANARVAGDHDVAFQDGAGADADARAHDAVCADFDLGRQLRFQMHDRGAVDQHRV
jgi:hypothetical protein